MLDDTGVDTFAPPAAALRFIELLTGFTDSVMHFRTFMDRKDTTKTDPFNIHGELDKTTHYRLTMKQTEGHGAFICVNSPTNLSCNLYADALTDEDITNVRALFVDSDGAQMPEHWHLKPTFICWRSDTHWHAYWVIDGGYNPAGFKDAQLGLADHYNTDRNVSNPSRVMRVPGYLHLKEIASTYEIVEDIGPRYTAEQVLAGIEMRPKVERKPQHPIPMAELRNTLSFVEPTFAGQHNEWVGICKCIQDMDLVGDVSKEDRWQTIVDWCSGALWNARTDDGLTPETYKGEVRLRQTIKESKGRGEQTTYGTICHYAKESGWTAPRRKTLDDVDPDADPMEAIKWTSEIMATEYPPLDQIVEGLIVPGLTLLQGKPKVGKSLLAMEFCMAAACGGNALGSLQTKKVPVLALMLEDDDRRIKARIQNLHAHHGAEVAWVTVKREKLIGKDGLRFIERLIEGTGARVVIIDTLTRVRSRIVIRKSDKNKIYEDDYEFSTALQRFALQHDIALIVLHHDRKGEGDLMDRVSGTFGIAGGADHIIGMTSATENGAKKWFLELVGRELTPRKIEIKMVGGRWTYVQETDLNAVKPKKERKGVALLRQLTGGALTFDPDKFRESFMAAYKQQHPEDKNPRRTFREACEAVMGTM